MKSTAVLLNAGLMLEILAPCLAHATGRLHYMRTQRTAGLDPAVEQAHKQTMETDSAAEIVDRSVKQFFEKDVAVMLRGSIDLKKLKRGRYTHVVYTSEGVRATSTGTIAERSQEGMTLKSTAGFIERLQIEYSDIDTVVVARNRQTMEKWKARSNGRFLVMARGALELSKIRKGWYAHVTYTSGGNKDAATGEITHVDHRVILIKSWDRSSNSSRWEKELEIEYGDIETIAVTVNRKMIRQWRNARQPITVGAPIRIAGKLIYGALGGILGSAGGAILIGSIGMGFTENNCNRPGMRGGICIEGETALGLSLGYLLGVSMASLADPYDRHIYSLAGSATGCGAGVVMTMLDEDFWPSLLLGPLVGATMMSERSRRPPDAPGFSVGLAPRRNGSVTAVTTYRF